MTAHVQLTERETLALLDCVRQADAQRVHYPPHLLSARRLSFLAQIAADPSDCSDIPTDGVTEAEDARNSRPEPF
jgi:hypothetical protein